MLQQRRGAFFGDDPVGQDDHAVGEVAREIGVVRGDEEAPAFSSEAAKSLSERSAAGGIQRGGGLVHEKKRRIHGEGAGDGDALRLAARKLARERARPADDAEVVEQRHGPLAGLRGRSARDTNRRE
jgi:hypothetical protein